MESRLLIGMARGLDTGRVIDPYSLRLVQYLINNIALRPGVVALANLDRDLLIKNSFRLINIRW